MDEDYLKRFVIARLNAAPPDVSFSVGKFGDFTRDELIDEVNRGTKIGRAATEMELNFLRKLPKLAQMIG